MTDLADVTRLAAADRHLAVFTVARPDGTVHASVVSAGVIADPVDGSPGVAAVVGGGTRKLDLLRHRAGPRWCSRTAGTGRPSRGRCASSGPTTARTSASTCPRPSGRSSAGRRWDPRGLGGVRPRHGGRSPLCRLRPRADAITSNAGRS